MATREKPYSNYNFLVELGGQSPEDPEGSFSEVILPEARIEVITYRNGNAKTTEVQKIPGRVSYSNLILRRGVMGFQNLYRWWDEIRNGQINQIQSIVVSLLGEDRSPVMQWQFTNAWPTRLKYGPLMGEGDQVVVEELEIAFERMVVNFD
jgi:phage tail-like protein